MKKLVSENTVKELKKYIGQEIDLKTIEDTYQFFEHGKTFHGGRMGCNFIATLKAVEPTGITVIKWHGDPTRKEEMWTPFVSTKCVGEFYMFKAIVHINHKDIPIYEGRTLDPKAVAPPRIRVKFREYSCEHWPSMD